MNTGDVRVNDSCIVNYSQTLGLIYMCSQKTLTNMQAKQFSPTSFALFFTALLWVCVPEAATVSTEELVSTRSASPKLFGL